MRLTGLFTVLAGVSAALLAPASWAATPMPVWSAPAVTDPAFSTESFSCASSTLCLAVGQGPSGAQQYSVYNGTAWSAPAATGDAHSITALDCAPGTTFCAAGDSAGDTLNYSAGSWSAPVSVASAPIYGLSCTTTAFCLAIASSNSDDSAYEFATDPTYTYNGTSWSATTSQPTLDGVPAGVSCASSTNCVAIGFTEGAVYNGTGWSQQTLVSPTDEQNGAELTAVSCAPGTSTCVAVDDAGNAYAVSSGSSLSTQNIDSAPLASVSCTGASDSHVSCVALDTDGDALSTSAPTTSGSWNAGVDDGLLPGAYPQVSCPTTTSCGALDDVAFSSAAAGPTAATWTTGPVLGSGGYTAVSCVPDTTDCVAADATGHVVVSSGSTTSTPAEVDDDTPLTAIACPTTSVCFAGDIDGQLLTIPPEGGSPTVAHVASGSAITALACASASFCAAFSGAGSAFTYNGSSWSAGTSLDTAASELDALSCPSAGFCIGTDSAGNAVAYNGSAWSAPFKIDVYGGLDAVSCPDTTYCLAGDDHGGLIAYSGGTWGTRTTPLEGPVVSLACTSSSLCQIATTAALETQIDGNYYPLSTDTDVQAVSCSSSVYCVGADSDGNTLSFSGPPSNTAVPTISGTASQGATLTASSGSWLGSPTAYSYQWLSCGTDANCTEISGATSPSYTIPLVTQDEAFEVLVTASNAYGNSVATPAARTAVIGPVPPVNTVAPVITGTAAVGRTLIAGTGTWTGVAPISYAYHWYLCASSCAAITGATASTYAVSPADIGTTIAVAITATDSAGSTVVVSKLTGIIAAPTATLASWTAPLLHLTGTPGRLSSIKKAKGYTATFKAAIPGTVKITWTITEKIAHSKKTKTVTLASVSAKTKAPSTQLKVKLNATGVKLLKKLKREKVKATVTFTYAYGTGTRSDKATRILTLSH